MLIFRALPKLDHDALQRHFLDIQALNGPLGFASQNGKRPMPADRQRHTHHILPAGPTAGDHAPRTSTTVLARHMRRLILDALHAASITAAIDQTVSLPMGGSLPAVADTTDRDRRTLPALADPAGASDIVWLTLTHHSTHRNSP
ncbi:hypothetical protein JMJ56_29770 [Belnapia sp. T18]|uniref:Uncharacterized protein n=1 Tax=Belnapia arida TaxID=2804533 RepID=A0ABS1UBV7_9PROT|nr:hypothetical protein [Belnapia arida]MBL6082168.1 hypothetical protein [Belnapia arida]